MQLQGQLPGQGRAAAVTEMMLVVRLFRRLAGAVTEPVRAKGRGWIGVKEGTRRSCLHIVCNIDALRRYASSHLLILNGFTSWETLLAICSTSSLVVLPAYVASNGKQCPS